MSEDALKRPQERSEGRDGRLSVQTAGRAGRRLTVALAGRPDIDLETT